MLTTIKTVACLFLVVFSNSLAQEDDPYRLPPIYKVLHEDISLTIPPESFTNESNAYQGFVQIIFQVRVNTSEIKLHASTNIVLLSVQLDDEPTLDSSSYSVDATTDILTISLKSQLETEKNYTLKIDFNSTLLSGGGFYKAAYTDYNGNVQYIATTQFEATSARNAFPCFDEPVYKASFKYNLTYPSDMKAWTNTPIIDSYNDTSTNLTTTSFDKSPVMPVYLVAFMISKYTCSDGILEGNSDIVHQVCSREDKESARAWALELTPKVIESLNTYTGYNYSASLSKLDQIAVAGKSGAMENWGLVLYSETGLLFDKTIQTNVNKQSIAAVISHELAHQWFGNLVTCKWWSETYLNEGFATMFEYYTTGEILSGFEMEKQFVIKILQPMLSDDGDLSKNVPAIRSNASTPSEISAKFGRYSYYKGGSILRMIEHILGRENFRAGIQKYLRDNAYGSAEPQDLWDALEAVMENEVSNLPLGITLSTVLNPWIEQSGYPLVTVGRIDNGINITQKRFLISGDETEPTTWYVPISYTSSLHNDNNEDTSPKGWVTPNSPFTITNSMSLTDWIVVNNQQTGYYRVNYDSTLWNNLADALKQANFSGIHVANRAQIVEDSFVLAQSGVLNFSQALKNIEFLENDTSYFSWYPAVNGFWYLLGKSGLTSKLGAALTGHFLQLSKKVVASVPLATVNDEDQIYTLNQVLINNYACKLGNADCIANATNLFAAYKNTGTRPDINTRSIVYCNAIRYSSNAAEDWNFLWEQYKNNLVSADRNYIWTALGCATDTAVLKSFLSKIITSDSDVTALQYNSIFSTIYQANEVGVDTALDYLIENYDALIQKYNSESISANSIFTGLGAVFTKPAQIEKLQKFIDSGVVNGTLLTSANSALTTAKKNQELLERHKKELYSYFELEDDVSSSTTPTTPTTSTTSTTPTTPTTSTTSTTPRITSTKKPDSDSSGAAALFRNNWFPIVALIILINIFYSEISMM